MYQQHVTTQEEALSHLFIHCCFLDGDFTKDEIKSFSEKIELSGLHKSMNFTDEVVTYKNYRSEIVDAEAYIAHLVQLIRPTNELALFSYCTDLCLSDQVLQLEEETLLAQLGNALGLSDTEQDCIKRLMLQRKVVETQQLF